jgi:hypothetical protein
MIVKKVNLAQTPFTKVVVYSPVPAGISSAPVKTAAPAISK